MNGYLLHDNHGHLLHEFTNSGKTRSLQPKTPHDVGTPAIVADLARGEEFSGNTGLTQSPHFSDFQGCYLSLCHPLIQIFPSRVAVR